MEQTEQEIFNNPFSAVGEQLNSMVVENIGESDNQNFEDENYADLLSALADCVEHGGNPCFTEEAVKYINDNIKQYFDTFYHNLFLSRELNFLFDENMFEDLLYVFNKVPLSQDTKQVVTGKVENLDIYFQDHFPQFSNFNPCLLDCFDSGSFSEDFMSRLLSKGFGSFAEKEEDGVDDNSVDMVTLKGILRICRDGQFPDVGIETLTNCCFLTYSCKFSSGHKEDTFLPSCELCLFRAFRDRSIGDELLWKLLAVFADGPFEPSDKAIVMDKYAGNNRTDLINFFSTTDPNFRDAIIRSVNINMNIRPANLKFGRNNEPRSNESRSEE